MDDADGTEGEEVTADSKRSRKYRTDNDGKSGKWTRRNEDTMKHNPEDPDCTCAVCEGRAPDYELSKNQQKFVDDARKQGFAVDYGYSGRFMYGQRCPAVRLDNVRDLPTKAKTEWDNMGLGYVVYARF